MNEQQDHFAGPTRRLASYQISEPSPPGERARVARCSTRVSIAVNIVLVIFQVMVGIFAHSQALIADAIHSLSDILADFVVLWANRHAARAADASHPFGHRRFETIASLIIGLIMLGVGLAMIWSAGLRLTQPWAITTVHLSALFVAFTVLLAKEMLFRYMLHQAQRVRSALLVANAWHARSDAASSLVAGIGILANMAGFPMADPLAALLVGAMIAHVGGRFSVRALRDLADHAVDKEIELQIRQALHNTQGLPGFHDLKTRKSGDMILVEVHLEFPSDMTILTAHNISEQACLRIMQLDDILQVTTHFDPVSVPVSPSETGKPTATPAT